MGMYQSTKITTTFHEKELMSLVGATCIEYNGDYEKMTATIRQVRLENGEVITPAQFKDQIFEQIQIRNLLRIPLARKTQIRFDVSAFLGPENDEGGRPFMQSMEAVIEQKVFSEGDVYYQLRAEKAGGEAIVLLLEDRTYEQAFERAKRTVVSRKYVKGYVETITVTPIIGENPGVIRNLEALLS
jgi:hypothetical protein